MTRPAKSPKVLLLADSRNGSLPPSAPIVKRYRLARVRADARVTEPGARFEYLKRTFD